MVEESQKQYVDELYKTVHRQFVTDGIMRELRCQFQTRIIEMMRGEREEGESLCGANVKLDGDLRIVLTNQLIMEYLHWYGYKYTAQTMSMETGEENKPPLRESLEGMVGPMSCPQLPILLEVVANMVSQQERRVMKGTHALEEEKCCESLVEESRMGVTSKQYKEVMPRSNSLPTGKGDYNADVQHVKKYAKEMYLEQKPLDRDALSMATETTVFCRSHFENDEEVSDNCSLESNFGPLPSMASFSKNYSSNENLDIQVDIPNNESIRNIVSKGENNAIEHESDNEPLQCYEDYRVEANQQVNDELVAEEYVEDDTFNALAEKTRAQYESDKEEIISDNEYCELELDLNRQTNEELVPDDYDSQNCSDDDENFDFKEDEPEEVVANEDAEYLDDEAFDQKMKSLQRELQLAMLQKVPQNYDDDSETNDDDSVGSINDDPESDEDVHELYQHEEQEEYAEEA